MILYLYHFLLHAQFKGSSFHVYLPLTVCDVNAKRWGDKLTVAAIDFGTTYSGCAVSYLTDTRTVGDVKTPRIIVPHWHSNQAV